MLLMLSSQKAPSELLNMSVQVLEELDISWKRDVVFSPLAEGLGGAASFILCASRSVAAPSQHFRLYQSASNLRSRYSHYIMKTIGY